MAKIIAFRGIRPVKELAHRVAAKPYDVLSVEEARVEAKGNPFSFLHITRAEIDLPEGIDIHSEAVYRKAAENLQRFLEDGILFQDDAPYLYIYSQTMSGRTQTGLVACSSIDDYFNDVIKKHEHTRPEKEKDRIDHMLATGVHPGPVFLTYRNQPIIDKLIVEVVSTNDPEYDFNTEDSVRHQFWVIRDLEIIDKLTNLFNTTVKATYIADGHHRAAASAKVGKIMREQHPGYKGDEPFNYFLSVLFPSNQLHIMEYNRVVKDLNGLTPDEFLIRLEKDFHVKATGDIPLHPNKPHTFGLYIKGEWFMLEAREGIFNPQDPIDVLDVTILQRHVFDKILGIKDPRTDKRIDFVGGIRGLSELERRVDSGEWAAAFSLYPVTIQQLMDIADAGLVMPPKSTWFEPKLRSGLIVHRFKED